MRPSVSTNAPKFPKNAARNAPRVLTYQCSTHAAQRLLSSAGGKALEKLGESVAFELVVGFNGRCWIDAATAEDQIVVARTLAGGGALY